MSVLKLSNVCCTSDPVAPLAITTSDVTPYTVTLAMTQVGDVNGYIINFLDDEGLERIENVTSNDHTATISDLKPGTSYQFEVHAWSRDLLSRDSAVYTVTVRK